MTIWIDLPAGRLIVRARMATVGPATAWGSWYADGPIEVAASESGRWGLLREDWQDEAEDALRRAAARRAYDREVEIAEEGW